MRDTFPETNVHPAIVDKIATYRKDQVAEVKQLLAAHRVVVIGMSGNSFVKRARRLLDSKRIAYQYLGIGSYVSQYHARLVLKMWTGWPTFPMVFVDGVLLGGFEDLERLASAGELERTLSNAR